MVGNSAVTRRAEKLKHGKVKPQGCTANWVCCAVCVLVSPAHLQRWGSSYLHNPDVQPHKQAPVRLVSSLACDAVRCQTAMDRRPPTGKPRRDTVGSGAWNPPLLERGLRDDESKSSMDFSMNPRASAVEGLSKVSKGGEEKKKKRFPEKSHAKTDEPLES